MATTGTLPAISFRNWRPRRYFGAAKSGCGLGRLWDIDWHGALLRRGKCRERPGVEVVLFCAGLSTVFLFGFWFCLERTFQLTDRVTIERDESAGIRIGGWI